MGDPSGVCPLFLIDRYPYSYCGCDGVTYYQQSNRQYPYQPYSHVGACASGGDGGTGGAGGGGAGGAGGSDGGPADTYLACYEIADPSDFVEVIKTTAQGMCVRLMLESFYSPGFTLGLTITPKGWGVWDTARWPSSAAPCTTETTPKVATQASSGKGTVTINGYPYRAGFTVDVDLVLTYPIGDSGASESETLQAQAIPSDLTCYALSRGTGGSSGTATGGAGGPDARLADAFSPDLAPPDVHRASETNPASCQYLTAGFSYLAPAFTFSVTLPDGSSGTQPAIDGGSTVPYWPAPITNEISGRVTASSGTDLNVDTCEAGSGCSPNVYRFSFTAPGLTLTVPLGRRVSVWWWAYYGGWSYGRMLAISDGVSVDASTGTSAPLWLAGSDSVVNQPLPVPFSVAREELFCNPSPSIGQGCGGNDVPPDDYAFQFTPRSADRPLSLATGETGTLALTVGSGVLQHLTIHNLRSYQTLGCDDYSNWAWWATGHAGANGEPE